MAWRGIYRGNAYLPTEVYQTEFDTARRLGLPITVHIGTVKAATQGHIEGLRLRRHHRHWGRAVLEPGFTRQLALERNLAELRTLSEASPPRANITSGSIPERGAWARTQGRPFSYREILRPSE
jgi:hypothetical protein